MNKQQDIELFESLHAGFFERESIKSMDSGEVFEEMLLALDAFDGEIYKRSFDESVTFGFFDGKTEDLLNAVASVDKDWVEFFGEGQRVYCGFIGGETASFCIVEDMGAHLYNGRKMKFGGIGCVGTLPKFRNRGIGLTMVSSATQILKNEGFDYSYIHFTAVAPWYERLGYKIILRWNAHGIINS